jgi:hypothetical protein
MLKYRTEGEAAIKDLNSLSEELGYPSQLGD